MYYISSQLVCQIINKEKSQGFTLIELIVVAIIIGIFSAIALPSVFGQIDKSRTAEARQFLGTLNRAQQAYYFEQSSFADDMTKLGADLTLSSNVYNYSISPLTSTAEVHHMASPQPLYTGDVQALTSAVYRIGDGFSFTLCIANNPGDTPDITSSTSCDNGNILN